MSVFKDIPSEDVSITTYISHKNWEISSSAASSSFGVLTFLARSGSFGKPESYTALGSSHTYFNKLVWDSINHQLYNPHRLTQESLGQGQASSSAQGGSDFLSSFLPDTVTPLQDSASILSIPQQLYGNEIKEGSLSIESGSTTLTDSHGKILSASVEVGDIFYKKGIVVITHPSKSIQDSLNTYNLRFKATLPITQREYTCRIMDYEYNHTFNPSVREIDNFVRTRNLGAIPSGKKIDLDLSTPIFGTTIHGVSKSINDIAEANSTCDLSLQSTSGSTSIKIEQTAANGGGFLEIPFNTTYNQAAIAPNTQETIYSLEFDYVHGSGSLDVFSNTMQDELTPTNGGLILSLTGSDNGNKVSTVFTSSQNFDASLRLIPKGIQPGHQDKTFSFIKNLKLQELVPSSNQIRSDKLKGFTSSSDFTPYITAVGLYNPANELLAVGKLAIPTKKSMDYDISIVVRFDL